MASVTALTAPPLPLSQPQSEFVKSMTLTDTTRLVVLSSSR